MICLKEKIVNFFKRKIRKGVYDMSKKVIFANRELSWLKFNERVLEEAAEKRVPLCERLFFLSIFQSNLDEFFRVRVGTLQDQMLIDEEIKEDKTKMTSKEQIDAIITETNRLCEIRDSIYDKLKNEIRKYGIKEMKFYELTIKEATFLEIYFDTEIAPLLSPMIVGKQQSFPFMSNGAIYAVVVMETTKGKEKIGIIPCGSSGIERIISIPPNPSTYILVEEIILHFVKKIFPKYHIKAKSLVKLTRNADIDIDAINDEDLNYSDVMREAMKRRKKLAPVKLDMTRKLDMKVIRVLCSNLGLNHSQVFLSKVPLNMDFVSSIRDDLRDKQELFYPKFVSNWSLDVKKDGRILEQVEARDLLFSYPYESIKPFLEMLYEATNDEEVISIKMTLYRLAKNSKVIDALIEAVENGKEVVVLVELKARFDEENNIEYARKLENAGCQVIYGIESLKVHSKICLITKKKNKKLEYISQIGTGNYNEQTAELYTDLTLITSNFEIGMELSTIFKQIGIGEIAAPQKLLLVAPKGLQNRLLDLMDEQIHIAKNGGIGYIGVKINSLTDMKLMKKLVEASQAGVKIDLLVRGICCLIPNVKGFTENITVISIIGRYLEHSRIYIFGKENDKIYIGSADWMTRNTRKRIEVAVPILDENLKKRIRMMLYVMQNDHEKAWKMESTGFYKKVDRDITSVSSQDIFCEYPQGFLVKE